MSQVNTKVTGLSAHEAKVAGRDAANMKSKHDAEKVAQILSVAATLTTHNVQYYVEGLRDRFEMMGYASAASMASRYKGVMLYAIDYVINFGIGAAKDDLSKYTMTEIYSLAKEEGKTANGKDAGPKKQTVAQQIDNELAKLIKKFGMAKVKVEAAKLLAL